jgi:hypothetical protein
MRHAQVIASGVCVCVCVCVYTTAGVTYEAEVMTRRRQA